MDYLNADGVGLNWFTGKHFSEKYKDLSSKWRNFSVYQNITELNKFIHAMKDDDIHVIVAKAGTGTGKTVILPKVALKAEIEKRSLEANWRIAVTIPKSDATKSAGEYAADTLDATLGQEVSYIYRGSRENNPDSFHIDSRLIYITDGYLLAITQKDELFSNFSVIIIDEAHERSKNIDILMYRLKKAVIARKGDLKVVIISATIDPKIFKDYFCPDCAADVSFSRETSYPIQDIFVPIKKNSGFNTDLTAVNMALKNSMKPGDAALYFVDTATKTVKGCKDVSNACKQGQIDKRCRTMSCSPLSSKMSADEKDLATGINNRLLEYPYDKKIVFSTNLAESSITINNLKVVIDSGFEFQNKWNPLTHASEMGKEQITKAQIEQRRGRVGRKDSGTVYYLYDKENYEKRDKFPAPNIHKSDITEDVLKMMKREKNIKNTIAEFNNYLTPPTTDQLTSAFHTLYRLDCITKPPGNNDSYLTPMGNIVFEALNILKTDMWNIMPLISCIVMFDIKSIHLENAEILTSILEEFNNNSQLNDPLTMFFSIPDKISDIKKQEIINKNTPNKYNYDYDHEHLAIVNLYKTVEPITYLSADVNKEVIERIRNRIIDIRNNIFMSNYFDSPEFVQDRLSVLNMMNGKIARLKYNESINHLERYVAYARNLHFCEQKIENEKKTFKTLFTLKQFQGEFKNNVPENDIKSCIYEKATIRKGSPIAEFNLRTIFPKKILDVLK
jgi:HrpA-like RNA helicase